MVYFTVVKTSVEPDLHHRAGVKQTSKQKQHIEFQFLLNDIFQDLIKLDIIVIRA